MTIYIGPNGEQWRTDEVGQEILRPLWAKPDALLDIMGAIKAYKSRELTLLELEQVGARLGLADTAVWNLALGLRQVSA
jgi:hypothetical protein